MILEIEIFSCLKNFAVINKILKASLLKRLFWVMILITTELSLHQKTFCLSMNGNSSKFVSLCADILSFVHTEIFMETYAYLLKKIVLLTCHRENGQKMKKNKLLRKEQSFPCMNLEKTKKKIHA